MKKSNLIIKKLRKDLGQTQKEFSEKVGVNQSYISHLETGRKDISVSLLLSWCQILNIKNISIEINTNNITYR